MGAEPVEDSAFELCGRDFVRPGVNRARHLPHDYVRGIACLDFVGVERRDVAVTQPVNEHHRNPRSFNRLFRRGLFHIQTVAKTNIKESHFDGWPKECAAEPWSGVEFAAEPRVSDFSKAREWRLSNHRAEAGFFGERLKQLGSSHGFSEAVHAARMMRVL